MSDRNLHCIVGQFGSTKVCFTGHRWVPFGSQCQEVLSFESLECADIYIKHLESLHAAMPIVRNPLPDSIDSVPIGGVPFKSFIGF